MEIGEIIRKCRLEAGLTQEELGEKLGVQKSAIAKYESGRVENLKRKTIAKMAEVFGVSPMYLMGYEDDEAIAMLRRLDQDDRIRIMERMEVLLEQDKYKREGAPKGAQVVESYEGVISMVSGRAVKVK